MKKTKVVRWRVESEIAEVDWLSIGIKRLPRSWYWWASDRCGYAKTRKAARAAAVRAARKAGGR